MTFKASKTVGLAGAFSVLLSANPLFASDEQTDKTVSENFVTSEIMDAGSDWDYTLDASGARWLAYYDTGRLLRLRDPQNQERLLVPDNRAQSPSGLAMAAIDKGAGVLWRDKYPKKGLYFLPAGQSPEGTPQEIGGDSQPLARFTAETDAHGLTHFLWYGEKTNEPTGEQHNLYYRNLKQSTGDLSEVQLVMAGIYPVMAVEASGKVMALSWRSDGEQSGIMARFRDASTEGGFGEAVKVAEVPEVTPIFDAFTVGKRWFAVWLGQYGADRRDFRLEGAYSDDDGANWKGFVFDGLKGFDVASLQIASDDNAHILLAVTARKRDDQSKQDVYVIRSADTGSTWSQATRLRALGDTKSNDLSRFHARNPSVTFGKTAGEVLVVWEDWRTIRAGLHAALSKDFGETWTLNGVALPRETGVNLGLRFAPNALYSSGESYHVLAERYTNDRMETKRLVQIDLDAAKLANIAQDARPIGDADALRQRADAYWQAMRDGEFDKTYDYLDPFFKASTPLERYSATMGKIKYAEAKVGEIRIEGPVARVTTNIRASIPEFKMPTTGEVVSRPEREVAVENTWLWVDGEWVKEFRLESQNIVFTRY